MTMLSDLRTRAAQALSSYTPSVKDAWIDAAEHWLEHTASAIEHVSTWAGDATLQPAITLDAPDASQTALWAAGCGAQGNEEVTRSEPAKGGRSPAPHTAAIVGVKDTVWGVADAARALRQGELSPLELVDASRAHARATEHDVRAWEHLSGDASHAAVHASVRSATEQLHRFRREGGALGLLCGIPYGVKDNMCTQDVPTTGSSALYRDFVPTHNADVINALQDQSAILFGKTTATELALGDPPPTRNPWNLNHTPGGSSAGSAAAVAACHVPFALASQTGGSINRPAGYCGLVAVKPTWGRISRAGVLPLAWTLDHIGAMTRTVEDQAWVFDALCGTAFRHALGGAVGAQSSGDTHAAMRIGRPDRYFLDTWLHPAQRQAYEAMLAELQRAGMTVVDVSLPPSFEVAIRAHMLIMQCEVATGYAVGREKNLELLRPTLRSRILAGLATPAPVYLRAQQIRREHIAHMNALFEDIDVLATPTTPTPADEGIEYSGSAAFNSSFSMIGFPTMVFPTGLDKMSGCPLSAQLVARPNHEEHLFNAAFAYEQRTEGNALSHVYAG